MELTHRFSVPAPLDQAWTSFNDLESIAPCFPGATITGIDGDDFTGTVKIKLGPIAMLYNGTGTFATRDEDAHHAVIEAKGKDKRGNGTASATVSATFSAEGDQTVVEVRTDLTVTGKPAQFGRGVISDISDKLLKQFVDCISGRFVAGRAQTPTTRPRRRLIRNRPVLGHPVPHHPVLRHPVPRSWTHKVTAGQKTASPSGPARARRAAAPNQVVPPESAQPPVVRPVHPLILRALGPHPRPNRPS